MIPAPTKCPLCGSAIAEHNPETIEEYENWTFMCDAEIVRDEKGRLMDNEDCRDAFRDAVQKLNAVAA